MLVSALVLNTDCFNPASIYPFKVNSRNTRCKVSSKLKIKTPKRFQGVVIAGWEEMNYSLLKPAQLVATSDKNFLRSYFYE